MAVVILIVLIPAAYYLGRYAQWHADAKRVMGSWKDRQR
jgi:hypothetical protein